MSGSEARSSWAALRRNAGQLSVMLVKTLQDNIKSRGVDPDEQLRPGGVALECLRFRRSLLARRRGPKWREEEQLRKMEKQVDSTMARLEKMKEDNRAGNYQTELKQASSDLQQFCRLRKHRA